MKKPQSVHMKSDIGRQCVCHTEQAQMLSDILIAHRWDDVTCISCLKHDLCPLEYRDKIPAIKEKQDAFDYLHRIIPFEIKMAICVKLFELNEHWSQKKISTESGVSIEKLKYYLNPKINQRAKMTAYTAGRLAIFLSSFQNTRNPNQSA